MIRVSLVHFDAEAARDALLHIFMNKDKCVLISLHGDDTKNYIFKKAEDAIYFLSKVFSNAKRLAWTFDEVLIETDFDIYNTPAPTFFV